MTDSAPARVLPGMKTPALGFLTVGICEAQNLVFSTVERPVALLEAYINSRMPLMGYL